MYQEPVGLAANCPVSSSNGYTGPATRASQMSVKVTHAPFSKYLEEKETGSSAIVSFLYNHGKGLQC